MNELQALVDALAVEIRRPVGVDDRRFRAIAYSSHGDEVDDVRRASILRRRAPDAVTEWLRSLGIADASSAVRVPANRELGMSSRVCVPMRLHGSLLGYLWLIDEPEPVSRADEQAAQRCAGEAAAVLYKLRSIESKQRTREAELASKLLLGVEDPRPVAAHVNAEFLDSADSYVSIVMRPVHRQDDRQPSESVRVRLTAAFQQVRRGVPPRNMLTLTTADQAIGVFVLDEHSARGRAEALLAAGEEHFVADSQWSLVVGIGSTRSRLADIRESYREACDAVRVAMSVADAGRVVAWSQLGAYRTILRMLGTAQPAVTLPDSFRRLLQAPDAQALAATLEAYLDHGCDVQAAAAVLSLHRSSLYHRLHRIDEVAGVQLRGGDARLEMHLGLRIWRLAGSPSAAALAELLEVPSPPPARGPSRRGGLAG